MALLPERLFKIMQTAADGVGGQFPPTEIYNEGWMLRLVLDAATSLGDKVHPFQPFDRAKWYSEVRLASPFLKSMRLDPLSEGFTHADAVVGQFDFRPDTRAGLSLTNDCQQFIVVEAKMFSNLSSGVSNAPTYNQAARNVACMAHAIAESGRKIDEFERLGFYVIAPSLTLRERRKTNLERLTTQDSIAEVIDQRIRAYEEFGRPEAARLRQWQSQWLSPLLDRLQIDGALKVLSWDDVIDLIEVSDSSMAEELSAFYSLCLEHNQSTAVRP